MIQKKEMPLCELQSGVTKTLKYRKGYYNASKRHSTTQTASVQTHQWFDVVLLRFGDESSLLGRATLFSAAMMNRLYVGAIETTQDLLEDGIAIQAMK